MGKIEHTPGPFEFRTYGDGCTIVSTHEAPGRSVRDALKGVSVSVDARICDDQSNVHDASPDARLLVRADHAPHECSDAKCPGNRNRLKLLAAEGLLEAAKATLNLLEFGVTFEITRTAIAAYEAACKGEQP